MNTTTHRRATTYPYEPDYAVPPGELIADFLDEEGMTQVELARRLGVTPKHINQIVAGTASLSSELAILIERVSGIPARMLNSMEADYQDHQARQREADKLAADVEWLDQLPLKAMIKRGCVEDHGQDRIAQLRSVLRFFGVARRATFDDVCASAAYRTSKTFESDPNAVAVWLRIGELMASQVACRPFDRHLFRTTLDEIRALTRLTEPGDWEPELRRLCADAGVAVVFVAEIDRTRLSGATMWLTQDKAAIILSLRYRWADVFWFTFFHEAAHLLLHSKKRTFIDGASRVGARDSKDEDDDPGDDDELEREADEFARNLLIPPRHRDRLSTLRSADAVRSFAGEIGVGAAIVVGRLHHDALIPQSWFNKPDLRPRYTFTR